MQPGVTNMIYSYHGRSGEGKEYSGYTNLESELLPKWVIVSCGFNSNIFNSID